MKCNQAVFSGHAIRRMFERRISKSEALKVISDGDVIAEYPDDEPFPSFLMLGFVGGRPIHVVAANEADVLRCHVITAYDPDPALWDTDFRKRRAL